jgi:hypothetical protein
MAIELKEDQEEKSLPRKIAFVIALFLLLFASLGYVYLKYIAIVRNEARITELGQALSSQKSIDLIQMETEAFAVEKMIGDYKILFENRSKTSAFFNNFEAWAHPQISYSAFNLNIDTRTITMKGTTSYFGPIIQQMDIFKNQPMVENYLVSNVKLADSGGVVFDLSLTVKPELFK